MLLVMQNMAHRLISLVCLAKTAERIIPTIGFCRWASHWKFTELSAKRFRLANFDQPVVLKGTQPALSQGDQLAHRYHKNHTAVATGSITLLTSAHPFAQIIIFCLFRSFSSQRRGYGFRTMLDVIRL
jgi:hypothetical protein